MVLPEYRVSAMCKTKATPSNIYVLPEAPKYWPGDVLCIVLITLIAVACQTSGKHCIQKKLRGTGRLVCVVFTAGCRLLRARPRQK